MPHYYLFSSPLSSCGTGVPPLHKLCILCILLDWVSFIKVARTPKRFVTLWAHIKWNHCPKDCSEYFILVQELSFWMSLFLLSTNLRAVSLAIFFYCSPDNCNGSDWTLVWFQENFLMQKQKHKGGLKARVLNFKS